MKTIMIFVMLACVLLAGSENPYFPWPNIMGVVVLVGLCMLAKIIVYVPKRGE